MSVEKNYFEERKEELKLKKLELENDKLEKELKWTWKNLFKNVNIIQVLTLAIALGAATAAIRSNYFQLENKTLEIKKLKLEVEIDSFKTKKQLLIDSIYLLSNRLEHSVHLIDTLEYQNDSLAYFLGYYNYLKRKKEYFDSSKSILSAFGNFLKELSLSSSYREYRERQKTKH